MTEREAFEHHTGLSWEHTECLQAKTRWTRAWQASRQQALEEAASVCDGLTHALDNAGVSYHRPADAARCARAIRSLTSPIGDKA